ncbi:threonine aldolase family protein [Haloplanus aerogenes]|uniref:L-threonine aldolase n=1 Tax=Haloplanus aerogenes TaxID=660522 RepID=A0A3M0CWY2_9EURY|nr:GntG family PLP-dependent aldolase [Haloplanus aerogenes]AZH27082.1 low specificity L-threonine aldolase [Haloplanus aerogenes]RMB13417.1 L-threonine aldolase [Haloplanus aerogenes]
MIDLRSDTVTRPSDAMRDAARDADVGDDVYGDDPTVNDLERRAAELVGCEAALFVPTGTMGNQIAARVHADAGTEAIVDREAHVVRWEVGGLARHASLQTRTVDAERGVPTPEQIHATCHAADLHRPGTGLLCLENTHNARGGVAVPVDRIRAAADAAHDHGVPVHLDGARLFNACVALDADPAEMVAPVDSVLFCLSKGLGAPVGSMLAGSEKFVAEARRMRKLHGGGMRQAGIIAAPGLLALKNRDRLAVDHENAERLAAGLDALDGVSAPTPETNIVVADVSGTDRDAAGFVDACTDRDVGAVPVGDATVRFCTHLDVGREDVDRALERIEAAVYSSGST